MHGLSPGPASVAPPGLALNAKPTGGGAALRLAPGYWPAAPPARAVTQFHNVHSNLETVLFSEQSLTRLWRTL